MVMTSSLVVGKLYLAAFTPCFGRGLEDRLADKRKWQDDCEQCARITLEMMNGGELVDGQLVDGVSISGKSASSARTISAGSGGNGGGGVNRWVNITNNANMFRGSVPPRWVHEWLIQEKDELAAIADTMLAENSKRPPRKLGRRRVKTYRHPLDLLLTDGRWRGMLPDNARMQDARICNFIFAPRSKSLLTNKSKLAQLLSSQTFLPITHVVHTGEQFEKEARWVFIDDRARQQDHQQQQQQQRHRLWIVKPARGYGGKGLKLVRSLHDAHQVLNREHRRLLNDDTPQRMQWIVQEYIERPLLYRGFKFHFRLLVIVSIVFGEMSCFVLNRARLYRCSKKYIKASSSTRGLRSARILDLDKNDQHSQQRQEQQEQQQLHLQQQDQSQQGRLEQEVHSLKASQVTNIAAGGTSLWFPSQQTLRVWTRQQHQHMQSQMHDIVRTTFGSVRQQMEDEWEHQRQSSRRCCEFEFFGVDMLANDDFQLQLLEVNSGPGYPEDIEWRKDVSKMLSRCFIAPFCIDGQPASRNKPSADDHSSSSYDDEEFKQYSRFKFMCKHISTNSAWKDRIMTILF